MTHRLARGALALLATSVLASACGGNDKPAELTIGGAWARPTPSGATNGVVYLTITPDTANTITGASVSAGIAAKATLHTTSVGGDEPAHHGDDAPGDVVSMPATEAIEITAGAPFEFAPGSSHIMLTDLAQPLTAGTHFTLTLELASGRARTVDVTVADNPPDA